MAATSRSPLDHFPVELREKIFKEVLHYDGVLKAVSAKDIDDQEEEDEKEDKEQEEDEEGDQEVYTFDVSLLVALVNDANHYSVASEAFYKSNTFSYESHGDLEQLSTRQTCSPLNYIRYLELTCEAVDFESGDELCASMVDAVDKWPKLKVLRIALDDVQNLRKASMRNTILGLVQDKAEEFGTLTCKGVGEYVYDIGKRCEIRFEHFQLVRSWAKLQQVKASSLSKVVEHFATHEDVPWHPDYHMAIAVEVAVRFRHNARLQEWAELYDELCDDSDDSDEEFSAEEYVVRGGILTVFERCFRAKDWAPKRHEQLAKGVELRDIEVEGSSQELLEWAGDMIVANTEMFKNLLAGAATEWE